ncbi:MAG: hypothetical protein ABSH13_21835 [Candidatus Acidiferrum sp.]|jgi:hypothetical protein
MKAKTKTPRRPTLPRVADEMKEWSAMMGNELRSWPHVKTRPMFGMLGFYRKAKVFALLPVTRGIGAPNTIIFKMKFVPPELLRRMDQEPRVGTGRTIRAKGWHSFDLNSAEDLRDAVWWLSQAYELAK